MAPKPQQMQSMKDSPKTSAFRFRALTLGLLEGHEQEIHPRCAQVQAISRADPHRSGDRLAVQQRRLRRVGFEHDVALCAQQRAVVRGDPLAAQAAAAGRGGLAEGEAVGGQDVRYPCVHQVRGGRPSRGRSRPRGSPCGIPGGQTRDEGQGVARPPEMPMVAQGRDDRRVVGQLHHLQTRTVAEVRGEAGLLRRAGGEQQQPRARGFGMSPHLLGQAFVKGRARASEVLEGDENAMLPPPGGQDGRAGREAAEVPEPTRHGVVQGLVRRSRVTRVVAGFRDEAVREVVSEGGLEGRGAQPRDVRHREAPGAVVAVQGGEDGAVAREVEVEEDVVARGEARSRHGRVHQPPHVEAGGPGHAQEQAERRGGPEAGHGQDDLGTGRGLRTRRAARTGFGPRPGQGRAERAQMGEGEVGVAHAGGIRPAQGLRVEAVPEGVAYRARPELRARRRGRSGQEGPVLEERNPRTLDEPLTLPEDLEAGVVHFQDQGSHQAARRLRSRRSSR